MKKEPISFHKKLRGKIEIRNKITSLSKEDIKIIYTPGVADVCRKIIHNPSSKYELTSKGNNIAIITDGSRLLGLGDVGPDASLPVMEGKSVIYKKYGNVDAYPICLATKDKDKIIAVVEAIEPSFGAINLEDIESPKVLDISKQLEKRLHIPVFHDDRHGTSVITLAALINSLKIVGKKISEIKVVVAGAGSAGYGIVKLLEYAKCKDINVLDSKGLIYPKRKNLDKYKKEIARLAKKNHAETLEDSLRNADVFIGVSGIKNLLRPELIRSMKKNPIIFALTNPDPEISPKIAKRNGAAIVATGSYSYENTVNNAVVFPNFIRAILDLKIKNITNPILFEAAQSIAKVIPKNKLSKSNIIPQIDNKLLQKNIKNGLQRLSN